MRIAVLDFHPLASDSRVLRTAETLHQAGHEVLLVGYGPAPSGVAYGVALLPDLPSPFAIRAGILLRQAPANFLPASSHAFYWLHEGRRRARKILRAFRPDAVHANDWNTLPLALDAKAECGSRIVYDTHEMAIAEYEHSLKWRLAALAHVKTIEKRGIRAADAVITVSPGIAQALTEAYPGLAVPAVVRNVPDSSPAPYRPVGSSIAVLFHGLLRDNRGLEAVIDSVPLWRDEFRLILRGSGAPNYLDGLKARAESKGVADRIRFEPSVAPRHVVSQASEADIGLCILPDSSRHNRFALPNKLFEYLTAGLAVITSPLPDMAEILGRYECGRLTPVDEVAIADALNGLDRPAIDRMKRQALVAADALSWTRERETLISVYDKLPRASGS
ncbi:glycosyltransferase family 4 protein [Microvirga alba]|uniref:Glycosyltransferase family 4 protein n=1 Tax=Microvirga alba TaxID=2791025 RepID=A0A931BSH7_9HYPH|nr:glycosyltransferase family 4 protein [Microvirga alba]MBF9232990.1 glycosyltransferase family 4 protein [Microvirga alba]